MLDRTRNAWRAANPIARIAIVAVALVVLGGLGGLMLSGRSSAAASTQPATLAASTQPATSTPAGSSPALAPSTTTQPADAPAVGATQPRNGQPAPMGTTASTPAPTATATPPAGTQPPTTPPTTTPPPAPTATQPPAPVEWPQSTGGHPGGCWRDPCEHVYGLYAVESSYGRFPGCVPAYVSGNPDPYCASLWGGTWKGTATAACHVVIDFYTSGKPPLVYDFPAGASVSFTLTVYHHDVSIGYGCGVFTNG